MFARGGDIHNSESAVLSSQPASMSDSSVADVGPVEPGVRKLSELRVIDLKAELKRRNLDISGNKSLLSDRLKKARKPSDILIKQHFLRHVHLLMN